MKAPKIKAPTYGRVENGRHYFDAKYSGYRCEVCGDYIDPGEACFANPYKQGPKGGPVPVHQKCEEEFDALNGPDESPTPAVSTAPSVAEYSLREDNERLRRQVEALQARLETGESRQVRITVNDAATGERKEFKRLVHPTFDKILYAVEQVRRANRDRHASPYRAIWIAGPHGSGKSYACEQVAEVLGLRFGFESMNDQSTMSIIVGNVNPVNDTYRASQTYDFYRNGGIFVFEEAASAGGNVWTQLNACVASNKWSHSNWGEIEKHPDFVPIFVDNTDGRGPTPAYPNRRKMDESVMSRCKLIHFPYDDKLDREIAMGINPQAKPWVDWVFAVRRAVADPDLSIKSAIYVDPRSLHGLVYDLGQLRDNPDMTVAEVLEGWVWKGLSRDVRERILAVCPMPQGGI